MRLSHSVFVQVQFWETPAFPHGAMNDNVLYHEQTRRMGNEIDSAKRDNHLLLPQLRFQHRRNLDTALEIYHSLGQRLRVKCVHMSEMPVLRSGDQYLLTLADFSLENHDYAVPNRRSPGSFPESSSGFDFERSCKISCCFPKGTVPSFL
jgi:hypothetical protein